MDVSREQELIEKNAKKAGLRGKINAKCIECSYYSLDKGNWRQQVQNCNTPTCPLYDVRPLPST